MPVREKVEKSRVTEYCVFFPRASERRVLLIVGVCQIFSHLHIFSSSHLHIFSSSHLHIFSSSHPHIFTSSHLFIFRSSHLLIFTSSHLHIFSSSHHIFTSSHLHIFSSSSSHPHIFTFSIAFFIFSSSHLLIFTSHLHILTSSHSLLLSCPLALLPPCSLLLFYFSLKARGSANETARNATISHEMRFDRQKQSCDLQRVRRNAFARNEIRSPKTDEKLRFAKRPAQPFRTK